MMMKKYFVLTLLLVCSVLLYGQTPVLVPLDHNPALSKNEPRKIRSNVQKDTISLPKEGFFDDFSYYSRSDGRPADSLWIDQYVYINNHYAIRPPSIGVATFDALDANGKVYNNSATSFPADTLTSRPIDLEGLNNVWLSFFYQPQGYGDDPEPADSLIVQFKSPAEKWHTVRNIPGTTLHPFKQVMLPVANDYLYKGFQFRFVNYVSLEQNEYNPGRKGNADHWHIDYVYLNSNRSIIDTAMLDVAMVEPLTTLIKGYQSIPWNQFQFAAASRLEPKMEMTYRNNYLEDQPVLNRFFEIIDLYCKDTIRMNLGGADIGAGEIRTFSRDVYNPFETTTVDSALFELKGYLRTNLDDRKENDTVRFIQVFKNYFARDDGTPENGFGLSGYNAQGCAVACRYETFMSDTVRAIQIYFNPTDNHITAKYRFRIAVWRDNNGRPGEQVYLSSKEYSPDTTRTGKFTQYILTKPVSITKYYWIGWVQVTTGFLNVGFDHNYNDKGNLWYNDGEWRQDFHDGTLMIRPVFGKRTDFPTSAELPATLADTRMKIYPNPASQHIRIELETLEPDIPSDYDVHLYNIAGRLVYRVSFTNDYIDVGRFEPGCYIVSLIHRKSGKRQSQKLIITR